MLRITAILLLTIVSAPFFLCCKKDKNSTIHIEGTVINPNTSEKIEGAKILLSAGKLNTGGIFNASYDEVATAYSDVSGNFSFEFREEKYSAYRLEVSKTGYFGYAEDVSTNDINTGVIYSPVYNLYSEAYVKVLINNGFPFDSNDFVVYSFTQGYVNASGCCSNTLNQGAGMLFSDTLVCKTYGNQNITFTWSVSRNNQNNQFSQTKFCLPADTTYFNINY